MTEGAVGEMVRELDHRGPDDHGVCSIVCGGNVAWLANTRLSILDLSSAGHQPMQDAETGNCIVYNGEVYNFREIRHDLEALGARFHSDTDTEVVLKAYAAFGRACIERFRGMFAFALWDAQRHELFLCRDRLGLKPLYYVELPGAVLFASELRALLATGLVERRLDPAALETFLANGFVVSPRTMVAGARSLLPGCWMRVHADGRITQTSRYWKLSSPAGPRDPEELVSEARDRLAEAVRLRMVSDVPLGAFLSGGLDSSTVVALMKRSGGDVRTFAVTFDEDAYDESRYSRWVAEHLRTRHAEIRLRRGAFYEMVPAALAAMDQPTFDGVNTYCVSRAARESGLKVALSGLGADELFGGYGFFNSAAWLAQIAPLVSRLPRTLAAAVSRRCLGNGDAFAGLSGLGKSANLLFNVHNGQAGNHDLLAAFQTTQLLFPPWTRRALTSPEMPRDGVDPAIGLPAEFVQFLGEEISGETDAPSVFSKLALRLFLGERCLRDTDTMSMDVALEVRAPFTDHLFVENLTSASGVLRFEGAPEKPVLRQVALPFLGREYPRRKKQGFIFPFQQWLPAWEGFRTFTQNGSGSKSVADIGLNPTTVATLFNRSLRDPGGIPWSRPWTIFVAAEWCRRHRVAL